MSEHLQYENFLETRGKTFRSIMIIIAQPNYQRIRRMRRCQILLILLLSCHWVRLLIKMIKCFFSAFLSPPSLILLFYLFHPGSKRVWYCRSFASNCVRIVSGRGHWLQSLGHLDLPRGRRQSWQIWKRDKPVDVTCLNISSTRFLYRGFRNTCYTYLFQYGIHDIDILHGGDCSKWSYSWLVFRWARLSLHNLIGRHGFAYAFRA